MNVELHFLLVFSSVETFQLKFFYQVCSDDNIFEDLFSMFVD